MFKGTYSHQGPDLVIEGPSGTVIRVIDYYHADTGPDLYSETGAVLTNDVVDRLVGAHNPLVFAQSGQLTGQTPIGQVETLEGTAFATRANGQRVALSVGDPVYEDDLVETANDSNLGLTFLDETVFSLSPNARMILDEFVYEANGGNNSMVMNLVEGTFVFVTGQIAPTGNMLIETPVATMGIRGTTPIVMIEGQNGSTQFGILKDPDGTLGAYAIFDKITQQVIGRVADENTIIRLDQAGGTPDTIVVDAGHLAARAEAQSNAYFLYTVARERLSAQQQNDNQPDGNNTPVEDGETDPITTESIGEQGNLGSSGLNQFTFDFGDGLSDGSSDGGSDGTGPTSGGSGSPQSGGSAQSPGTFTQPNTPPVTANQTFQLSEDDEVAQASLSVTAGAGSIIYTITRQPEFGAVIVNADGTFTYIADPIFNVLQEGESAEISFDFQATDSAGAVSNPSTVTLQILGANDAPIATNIDAGIVNEDAGPVAINLLSTTLDPDAGDDVDTQNVSVVSSNAARSVVFTIDNESGLLTLESAQFDDLGTGESETLTINYTIVDSFGASTTNSAVLVVEGTDAVTPVIITGTMTGTLVEDAVVDAVSGDLNANDPNGPDDNWTVVGTGTASINGFGTFSIDAAGNWTYELDNTNPVVDALGTGEMLTDNFIVQTVDGLAQTVTITIDGADETSPVPIPILSSLDGTDGFLISGVNIGDQSGFSVSSAGDVNGDGFDDVIIGARNADTDSGPDAGKVYVVFGAADFSAGLGTLDLASLDGTDGFLIEGTYGGGELGMSVSGAGDINGDGIDDLVMGAPDNYNSGESFVVFGAAGIGAGDGTFDLSDLDGTNGFSVYGLSTGDLNGFSVSDAGDVNGDGFDDVFVAAPDAGANGQGYVIFGGSGLTFGGGLFDPSNLDGSNGFQINAAYSYGSYAAQVSISGVGDINGDGFDDLIAGSSTGGNDYQGESYVVFGGADFSAVGGIVDLDDLDGTNGFLLNGAEYGSNSGYSVSGAGDVNGDGFKDLIVGAPSTSIGTPGLSYVVFGGMDFAIGGGTFDLGNLDGTNGFEINGEIDGDSAGFSVSDAGDVNGDGFGDLLIGAPDGGIYAYSPDTGPGYTGRSYVVFGSSGIGAVDGVFDLAELDGSNGFFVDGISVGDGNGSSVSGAGDVNGDGFDDLIVASPGATSDGVIGAGETYILFGAAEFEFPGSSPGVTPLLAAPQEEPGTDATGDMDLSRSELDPVIDAAIARWAATGLDEEQIAFLQSVTFEIADLSGDQLGLAEDGHIVLDDDAAGRGWFIDATPLDDSEFANSLTDTQLLANDGQAPVGQIDLLTTILHEFGHELGLDHVDGPAGAGHLLSETLRTGERRLPDDGHFENSQIADLEHEPNLAPLAGDDGKAGEFAITPGESIDILVSKLLENDVDPNGAQFDLTEIFAARGGEAGVEQINGEAVVRFTADASAQSEEQTGFQYQITNETGGVGFAMVDIIIDDMSAAV